MNFRKTVSKMAPAFLRTKLSAMKQSIEDKEFNSLPKIPWKTDNLRPASQVSLADLFHSPEIEKAWEETQKQIEGFQIPDGTGGVNPGDRKALFYLISQLRPRRVLEIGTHIGASTVNIASALYKNQIRKGDEATLTTLDIRDVNSTVEKPWLEYGTKHSPLEMVQGLSYGSFVSFVANRSTQFLAETDQRFDFIFLDGDHSATTVYQEVPAALRVLNENGVILLHDYFPGKKPLWADGAVITGPYRGTERLIAEGADLRILPLGALPWPTKKGSTITSLALLLKNA